MEKEYLLEPIIETLSNIRRDSKHENRMYVWCNRPFIILCILFTTYLLYSNVWVNCNYAYGYVSFCFIPPFIVALFIEHGRYKLRNKIISVIERKAKEFELTLEK